MNIDLKKFVARVRNADAILATLSDPKNRSCLIELYRQCNITEIYEIYPKEVALAHLMPTITFLKTVDVQDTELAQKIMIIRNALAHAGEYIDKNKPNIELSDSSDELVFRTLNNGGQELRFKNIFELSEFIAQVNNVFATQIERQAINAEPGADFVQHRD